MMLSEIGGSGRKQARDIILRGPRGTGKTVLLTRFQQLAEDLGYDTISLQATKGRPGLVAGILARGNDHLDQQRAAWQRARDVLRRGGIDLPALDRGVTVHSNRQREVHARAFANVLATVAREIRAGAPGGGLLITVDELQVTHASDLALLTAVLQCLSEEHPDSSVAFAASAHPTIDRVLRSAGVVDRRFAIESIPVELDRPAARFAIVEPARQRGVIWDEHGASELLAATRGYPAHLQLFADQTWELAAGPHEITAKDGRSGIARAEQQIEIRTLEPRWLRASDRHVELLAALAVTTAEAGADDATTAQISRVLGRAVSEWSVARMQLINESDIYAPARGRLAFTVPSYAPFILRNYEARRAQSRLDLIPLALISRRLRARGRAAIAR